MTARRSWPLRGEPTQVLHLDPLAGLEQGWRLWVEDAEPNATSWDVAYYRPDQLEAALARAEELASR